MRILRKSEVLRITGLSASTIDRFEARGEFPARLRLGGRAVGWRAEEIEEWSSALRRCSRSALVDNGQTMSAGITEE